MTKKIYLSTLAASLVAFSILGCNGGNEASKAAEPATKALTTQEEKLGYAIGLQIGTQLRSTKDDINSDALILGLKDALEEKSPKLSEQEMQDAKTAFQQKVQARAAKDMALLLEKNKKEGEAFLAENKTKEGVITLPSGLQYKVLKAGTGATPKATDIVVTHYRGTLIDGKVFDSSIDRGEPAEFPVNAVIKGWSEALQHMKVGAKWQLFVPAELAYGERGAGQVIAPNSTLIFDIELLKIKK
jgi:FKBP-type peptidyl-prolyl cis-trans isomerase FklB